MSWATRLRREAKRQAAQGGHRQAAVGPETEAEALRSLPLCESAAAL